LSESVRSFLAFDLDAETVRKRLAAAQKLLVQTGADLKLVESQNIHLTIRFLGDIRVSLVEKIYGEMKGLNFVPFDFHISGLGAFPDLRYPRVLWAGMTEGADQMKSIFSQLEPRMQMLGFAADPKGFSPHLTIARVRSGLRRTELADLIKKNENYDFGTIRATCIRLKRSELTPRGPIYSTLREYCPQQ
jgi:2'-5' RNA ligase